MIDKVEEFGTVAAYLKQQDWWNDELTKVNTTAPGGASPPFAGFCRQIRASIADLGLNGLDGRIVATAISKSGFVNDRAGTALSAENDCGFL